LFGWLGDRLGRVRAMMLSVLTYAVFSGLCGLATAPWQIVVLRFIAALGMGGEWSLGVALVMEIWPNRSRALLAGIIGAAANVGYFLVAVVALGLDLIEARLREGLLAVGVSQGLVNYLMANSGWRLLLLLGATPAVLTFLIQLFVPESERWKHEKQRGTTSHWATVDLLGVLVGSSGAVLIIYLWLNDLPILFQIAGTLLGLVVVTVGYLYPIVRFLKRSEAAPAGAPQSTGPMVRTLLLGACLSGVALLATWGSIQWAPTWADQVVQRQAREVPGTPPMPQAKAYTQFFSAFGAIIGCVLGALLGDWVGRRMAYMLLCGSALASTLFFYQGNTTFGWQFLASVFVAGGLSASFYGWLPLYLPELFPTRLRATGQGFSFNFGRVLAAIGVLQAAPLMQLLGGKDDYAVPCSILSCIYVVGMVIIWFAPETRGKPLPE
jgi:MFS family permease